MNEHDARELRRFIDEAFDRAFEKHVAPLKDEVESLRGSLDTIAKAADARGDQILRTAEKCADQATACVTAIDRMEALLKEEFSGVRVVLQAHGEDIRAILDQRLPSMQDQINNVERESQSAGAGR